MRHLHHRPRRLRPALAHGRWRSPSRFAEQRQLVILDRLEAAGSVPGAALARQRDVAVETIRRELEQLERDGQLTRTHGGAVPRALTIIVLVGDLRK